MDYTKIKAVFFDIDGTLVSFKTHCIAQSTLDEVHRIRQKGIKVFIATGRPLPFIDNLGALEYDGIMGVNGACCTTKDGQFIFKKAVPRDDIERMVADAREHPIPVAFASADRAIMCNAKAALKEADYIFRLLDIKVPEERPIEDALTMEVMQCVAFFTADDEPRLMNEILKGCDATRWHPYFADCIAKGTSKATGIDEYCRHYGFDISETMAFGDGGNDIEMLRHVGIGVAMGNAAAEVKAAADVVTTTVDDDGIANILKNL